MAAPLVIRERRRFGMMTKPKLGSTLQLLSAGVACIRCSQGSLLTWPKSSAFSGNGKRHVIIRSYPEDLWHIAMQENSRTGDCRQGARCVEYKHQSFNKSKIAMPGLWRDESTNQVIRKGCYSRKERLTKVANYEQRITFSGSLVL